MERNGNGIKQEGKERGKGEHHQWSMILFLVSQEKIQGRLDFLKKERQELLEFKVNDDKKTQELLVSAVRCSVAGGLGWDVPCWKGQTPPGRPQPVLLFYHCHKTVLSALPAALPTGKAGNNTSQGLCFHTTMVSRRLLRLSWGCADGQRRAKQPRCVRPPLCLQRMHPLNAG